MTGLSRSTAPLRTPLESRLVMWRRELRSSHSSGEVTPACPISQYFIQPSCEAIAYRSVLHESQGIDHGKQ